MERSGCSLIYGSISVFAWRETSVSTVGTQVDIFEYEAGVQRF